ncbi:hypothetical protein BGZ63DRAFT_174820 [Mariannaea sp. PMI_226]|nr:hypothetical protein BGZ63DRAFT_174820 [Mariannaea sp. PMI_226]
MTPPCATPPTRQANLKTRIAGALFTHTHADADTQTHTLAKTRPHVSFNLFQPDMGLMKAWVDPCYVGALHAIQSPEASRMSKCVEVLRTVRRPPRFCSIQPALLSTSRGPPRSWDDVLLGNFYHLLPLRHSFPIFFFPSPPPSASAVVAKRSSLITSSILDIAIPLLYSFFSTLLSLSRFLSSSRTTTTTLPLDWTARQTPK